MPGDLLTRRLRPAVLYAIDAVAAVAITLGCWAAALAEPDSGRYGEPAWVSALTALAIGLPVAVRRHKPVLAAAVTTVASAAALLTMVIPAFASAAPATALMLVYYLLGTTMRNAAGHALTVGGGLLISGGLAVGTAVQGPTPGDAPAVFTAALFGLAVVVPAFLMGYALEERRAHAVHVSRQLVRQAAAEERLRVARELHDVVAHTMTLIVVKAAVGNHVAEASPEQARDALRVIERTGRGAMLEVRKVLDVLRGDTPYAPAPGLADLPGLVEQATMGGVEVRLEVGDARGVRVPGSTELAVYRIVQEAVTNVVKHAAPATCRVSVAVAADEVRVEVRDDGTRPARTGRAGHGLIGMRERVALHGGTFTAGPRQGGGFEISARLPVAGTA